MDPNVVERFTDLGSIVLPMVIPTDGNRDVMRVSDHRSAEACQDD